MRAPPFSSAGFRPSSSSARFDAGVAVLIWAAMLRGELSPASAFWARDWHVHEMLYGYIAAVITGFLLTAIPNWTGRLPLQGAPLLVLVVAWTGGRAAVSVPTGMGPLAVGIIDSAFLLLVIAAVTREIVAGRNWRNLKVAGIVAVLAIGNAAFHLEHYFTGSAFYSAHLAIAAVVTLVMLVGGRIIPSFTRNWLVRENPGRLPAPFDRFDMAAIGTGLCALVLWAAVPVGRMTGTALALLRPFIRSGCSAGPACAPGASRCCWCCMSATALFPSASH